MRVSGKKRTRVSLETWGPESHWEGLGAAGPSDPVSCSGPPLPARLALHPLMPPACACVRSAEVVICTGAPGNYTLKMTSAQPENSTYCATDPTCSFQAIFRCDGT